MVDRQKPARKRHHPLEPLTYKEAVESTSMTGLVSFLSIRPQDLSRTPEDRSTDSNDEQKGSAERGPAEPHDRDHSIEPVVPSSLPSDRLLDLPSELESESFRGSTEAVANVRQSVKIHRCLSAQDAHSLGEEALYQMLWREGKQETPETRIVAIGWKQMSKKVQLTDKNAKHNTQKLIQKLAIEVVANEDSRSRTPRTYRVYSCPAVLDRRRSAGFQYVTKNRGVFFVRSDGTAIQRSEASDLMIER